MVTLARGEPLAERSGNRTTLEPDPTSSGVGIVQLGQSAPISLRHRGRASQHRLRRYGAVPRPRFHACGRHGPACSARAASQEHTVAPDRGLVRPDRGRVSCSDAPLVGRLAWMGQREDLLPWLSARANVVLGARLRGEQPDLARADLLLERVGLARQRCQLPATLSGGERQRAALARTLMEDRPVVLMDSRSPRSMRSRARACRAWPPRCSPGAPCCWSRTIAQALRLGHRVHVMAGAPARIETPILPSGEPPRDLHDPDLMRLQGDLLARLADAQDLAA